jgi:hypothetical protein
MQVRADFDKLKGVRYGDYCPIIDRRSIRLPGATKANETGERKM